ncbi:MAG: FtsX-like permease family protein [Acidobacteriota bacterium]|nr:FtsX-like permease family protein [Acidobacteriota bacterium]
MGELARVARYRYRATFRSQLAGYLTVVLLVGVIGGVALASVAGARRTQSSFPAFLASTNPSTLTMAVYGTATNGPVASIKPEIGRLADVAHVVTTVIPSLFALKADGAPRLSANTIIVGSQDGMATRQDRPALLSGHPWDRRAVNQVVMSEGAARELGVRVGQSIAFGLYSAAQESLPGFGTPRVQPLVKVHARLVDIAAFNTQIIQDDIDQTFDFVVVSPALMQRLARALPGPLAPVLYGIQLRHGGADVARVEAQLIRLVPRGSVYEFHVTGAVTHQVELSIKPESVALGAFGAIAALACLVLAAQAVSRQLRNGDDDREVMRALGARPRDNLVEGLAGSLVAIAAGTLLALGVALALSPLAPLGPVRAVYPDRGFSVDGPVWAVGAGGLFAGLSLVAIARLRRGTARESTRRRAPGLRRAPVSGRTAESLLPVAGTVGVHFALHPGRGRRAVPARPVLAGTALAVALVVSTLTFASGLGTLVSHPPLYGWNWNWLLSPTNNVPPAALAALRHDPKVAQWSGADFTDLEIDNQEIPVLMQRPGATVTPPILSGHGLRSSREIVLGAATLAQLHKKIGDSVDVSLGTARNKPYYIAPTPLKIVGTATLPAVGYLSFVAEHTSMGRGALLPLNFTTVPFSGGSRDPNLNGPELVFVRMRSDVSAAAGRADMERIAALANRAFARDRQARGHSVSVLGVLRPIQIVNYRSIGSTPVILAGGLGAGSILALGFTLTSSVRRRRRDLAILKTLGFTRRQLAAAIAWQASVIAGVGVVAGLPIGIVAGRELWTLFARSINAVPDPTVPALAVALVGLGSLAFANLVASLPGRSAARTPAALALRAE